MDCGLCCVTAFEALRADASSYIRNSGSGRKWVAGWEKLVIEDTSSILTYVEVLLEVSVLQRPGTWILRITVKMRPSLLSSRKSGTCGLVPPGDVGFGLRHGGLGLIRQAGTGPCLGYEQLQLRTLWQA